ncbi:hypothetical protein L227DRAFT_655198 [Lentinus tigrinus ALCF2SS1-6]|uniref:Uncharacterized protein n=1 Tax=Lentinus tigrinus ALCF2SS1-6 TaxID=1328759 RepID=A0A5C2S344_9APHY|nr:hypothetical protein L227DRAFT_655198 [Lentinus tigrinus ALCF2SS1-6]
MSSHWKSLPGVPSDVPTHDPTCPLCKAPVTSWYKHNPFANSYLTGEIIRLHESVHAPIDEIFARSKVALSPARAASKGPRPAIVFGKARPIRPSKGRPIPTTDVLLLTTYKEIHSSKLLPVILKDYFAIPVSPHCEAGTCEFHIHIHPEWQKANTWLLLYPVDSSGAVDGGWQYMNRVGMSQTDLSFKVADKYLSILGSTWHERMDTYVRKCKDLAGYEENCRSVYDIFRDENSWEQRLHDMLPHRIDNIPSYIEPLNESESKGEQPVSPAETSTSHIDSMMSIGRKILTLEPVSKAVNVLFFGTIPAMQDTPAPGGQHDVD